MEENKRKEHLNDCRTLKKKKDMKLALERFFSWKMEGKEHYYSRQE
jgi:hypothetical protein